MQQAFGTVRRDRAAQLAQDSPGPAGRKGHTRGEGRPGRNPGQKDADKRGDASVFTRLPAVPHPAPDPEQFCAC